MDVRRSTVALVVGLLTGCGGVAVRAPATFAPPTPPPRTVAATDVAEAMPASPSASPLAFPSTPPTWTAMFAAYFGPGSPGSCGRAGRCHAAEMRDASSAYDWLVRRGYIDGTRSALVSPTNSCLRWFGGNMPPQAQPSEDATRDLQAWVAAGAPED
jgi:hypothetical protein